MILKKYLLRKILNVEAPRNLRFFITQLISDMSEDIHQSEKHD